METINQIRNINFAHHTYMFGYLNGLHKSFPFYNSVYSLIMTTLW